MVCAMLQANPAQQLSAFHLSLGVTLEFGGQHDILNRSQTAKQLKGLEHKTHHAAPHQSALLFIESCDFLVAEEDLANTRRIQARQQAQQRGFTGT